MFFGVQPIHQRAERMNIPQDEQITRKDSFCLVRYSLFMVTDVNIQTEPDIDLK